MQQVNKEEDDKIRTTAANLAARAAFGGDDMLSKWQLMAQARQKREGGPEIASSSQSGKDTTNKQAANIVGNAKEIRGTGKKDSSVALPASGNSVVAYCLIKKLLVYLTIRSSPNLYRNLHA